MSLLLDALKQAAHEKKLRDNLIAQNLINEEEGKNTLELDINEVLQQEKETGEEAVSTDSAPSGFDDVELTGTGVNRDEPKTGDQPDTQTVTADTARTTQHEDEEKHKQAITKLIALRKSADRQRLVKGTVWSGAIFLASSLGLLFYYQYTTAQVEKSLATAENFDQFVSKLTKQQITVPINLKLPLTTINEAQNPVPPDRKQAVKTSELGLEATPAKLDATAFDNEVKGIKRASSEPSTPALAASSKITVQNKVRAPEKTPSQKSPASVTPREQTQVSGSSNSETAAAVSGTSSRQNLVTLGKKQVDTSQERIQQAYRAYQKGELEEARLLYDSLLLQQPEKRDAILGAAAVAIRQGRQSDALSLYQQLLTLSPQDRYAQAGILSLQAADIKDPRWLSEVNRLLSRHPKAAHLHFLKANADAVHGRWQAAQQSYFEAWSLDKSNPDYNYNLAIALDHLGKPQVALNYYQQAMKLAAGKPSNIPLQDLQGRILQLGEKSGGR